MSPDERAGRAAVADLQGAGADRRAAGVGVGAGQDQRAGADLDEARRVPLMTPRKVSASLRLKTRVPLSTMSPATLPVVPPSPICSVPALIVVPPV